MNEADFDEIERVLTNISGARNRALKALDQLGPAADAHLREALERTADHLQTVHRELMQRTYFAVPESTDQQKLVA